MSPAAPARTTRAVAPAPVEKAPTVATQVVLTGFNSLEYLRTQKQPLYCSIDAVAAGVRRTGNVYVADGVARGDFASTAGGAKIATSMIDDGAYLYAWHTSATTGVKLQATASANGSVIATYGGLDPASDFSFSCARWTADAAVLTPPANITFSKG
jgi:hypothetical protein